MDKSDVKEIIEFYKKFESSQENNERSLPVDHYFNGWNFPYKKDNTIAIPSTDFLYYKEKRVKKIVFICHLF